MDIELSKFLIPAIVGLITGAIGSLIAPWVNWGIEKRKLIRQSKEQLIKNARDTLMQNDLSNKEFRHLPIYSQMKPYLSAKAIKAVEGETRGDGPFKTEVTILSIGEGRHSGVNPFKNQILDELSALERQWELI